MVIMFVVIGIFIAYCCFNGINEGLPNYIPQQNFGLVDILYRVIRIIGVFALGYPLITLTWHWASVLLVIFCFFVAFLIKKLTRYLAYKDWL